MRIIALILAVLLLLTACAPAAPGETPSAEASTAQPETAALTEATSETPSEATESVSESPGYPAEYETALTCIGKSADELKAAIGEPIDAYYEESCIAVGDDGILDYGTFTVYTFREADGSAETVVDAELND
ncbi:MAG: hypothetical protein IJJ99_04195 [Oscillospiraceae bacterium]|nr:hypothetical protein [Oscillospiraceae bacterium]